MGRLIYALIPDRIRRILAICHVEKTPTPTGPVHDLDSSGTTCIARSMEHAMSYGVRFITSLYLYMTYTTAHMLKPVRQDPLRLGSGAAAVRAYYTSWSAPKAAGGFHLTTKSHRKVCYNRKLFLLAT